MRSYDDASNNRADLRQSALSGPPSAGERSQAGRAANRRGLLDVLRTEVKGRFVPFSQSFWGVWQFLTRNQTAKDSSNT
jgi:hypothetical protein